MFVLVDIATMKARVIVWSIDKARNLKTSNTCVVSELPDELADDARNFQIEPATYFEGMTRYVAR